MQQDIIKSLSSNQNHHKKQEEMLKLLYDAMYGVLHSSFVNLESSDFTSTSPFPHDQPHTLDSLSLIYENCALFSDIYLRYPDMTESLYRKFKWADFSDLIKKSIQFCSESKEVFNSKNEHGKLLNLVMQELQLIPKTPNYQNPYRKVLPTPKQKTDKKREKKKLPRGPYISKVKTEL
ncbi:uncharacterized protein LOC134822258 [Bolinopsis microptera]|uniref:uncharacterized protein LOC134822258 n=1 Tax=Bolinopsis microptera TaxID=2820187 RepID=UPI0030798C4B